MHTFSLVLLVGALTGGNPAPAPSVPPQAAPASLPAPRFEGLPGWLGHGTVKSSEEKNKFRWSPAQPHAQAVLFTPEWKDVKAGTKVTLLSTAGARPATYGGTAEHPYGCDGGAQTLASFRAEAPLPEGPVWVLPEGSAAGAEALPVKEVEARTLGVALPKGKKGKELRAFDAGGLGFLLTKTGKLKGQLSVVLGGKTVATRKLEKGGMEGAPRDPLNLYGADEVGVPVPLAAFQLGSTGPTVVVLAQSGYEGENFLVAVREGDKARLLEDEESLYLCAF